MANEKVGTYQRKTKSGKTVEVASYARDVKTTTDSKGGVTKDSPNVEGVTPVKKNVPLQDIKEKKSPALRDHFSKNFPKQFARAIKAQSEAKKAIEKIIGTHQKKVATFVKQSIKKTV